MALHLRHFLMVGAAPAGAGAGGDLALNGALSRATGFTTAVFTGFTVLTSSFFCPLLGAFFAMYRPIIKVLFKTSDLPRDPHPGLADWTNDEMTDPFKIWN